MTQRPELPSVAEMLQWVEAVVAHGIRRPGYPADQWARNSSFRSSSHSALNPCDSNPWSRRSGRTATAKCRSQEIHIPR